MIFITNYIGKTLLPYHCIHHAQECFFVGLSDALLVPISLNRDRRTQMGFCCCRDSGERLQICRSYILCVSLSNEVDSRWLQFQTAFLLFYNDSGVIGKEKNNLQKEARSFCLAWLQSGQRNGNLWGFDPSSRLSCTSATLHGNAALAATHVFYMMCNPKPRFQIALACSSEEQI